MSTRYLLSPGVFRHSLVSHCFIPPAARGHFVKPSFFHTAGSLHNVHQNLENSRDHYETLQVEPSASTLDIKKSFYMLSKSHHPDRNPGDPHAPRRFMKISEAYAILSSPEKRAAYDRSIQRLHGQAHGHPRRGSYHSSSMRPAGGRPASGLSKRRGTFQGPPPSFYRSGGWGAQGTKRQAAHDSTMSGGTGTAGEGPGSKDRSHSEAAGGAGGFDPWQHPNHVRHGGARHFDHEAHEQTQHRIEKIVRSRRERGNPTVDQYTGIASSFMPYAALVGFIIVVSSALHSERGVKERKTSSKEKKAMEAS